MCGIAGIWGRRPGDEDRRTAEGMIARLRHRGPDGSGVVAGPDGILAHARLSIMDPRHGAQPYRSEDGRWTLAANGEIYNFRALRGALAGHRFGSRADTEVALHLLENGGGAPHAERVPALDGMFALAVQGPGDVLLARDPLGIKPLYLAGDADGVRFASEMKALQDAEGPIETVPPGSVWSPATGARRYYRVPAAEPDLNDPDEAAAAVRRTLTRAVEKRLMSDVPLGAFLSGGLDSSIIAAVAKRALGELHTFAVGVEGSDDIEAARHVARHLGTRHHEYLFDAAEVEAHFEEIVYALESFDQELVRSVVPTYFVARLAAERVKVVLTGEGADELFAGYRYLRDLEGAALGEELRRSLEAMHHINLQRVDRLTMAHGLEARVPFLDTEMVALAQRIAPALKLRPDPSGRRVEKWVLRRAFEDLLPRDIVWRDKAQFDEGSGTTALLARLAAQRPGEAPALGVVPASAEEAWYLRVFAEVFERPEALLPNIGRWGPGAGAGAVA